MNYNKKTVCDVDVSGKKVLLRGNHDYWWQSITRLRNILPRDFFAIQNDAVKIGNYIFFGTRGWLIPEGKQKSEEKIEHLKKKGEEVVQNISQQQKKAKKNASTSKKERKNKK